MGETEEAIKTFRAITAAYPRTSEAAEAQYRIGYIHEVTLEDYAAARLAYDAVRQQGTSIFGDQAKRRADGLARLVALQAADTLKATPGSAPKDQVEAAEKDFLAAELYYFQQDKADKALEQYALVEQNYPGTPFAARSALARAWILTFAMEDTAAGRQAYEQVMERYPRTEQAGIARQMLTGEAPVHARPVVVASDSLLAGPPADSAAATVDSMLVTMPPGRSLVPVQPAGPPVVASAPGDTLAANLADRRPVDTADLERIRRMNDSLAVIEAERRIAEAASAVEARRMADSAAAVASISAPPVPWDTAAAAPPVAPPATSPAAPPTTPPVTLPGAGTVRPPVSPHQTPVLPPATSIRTSRLAPASSTGLPRPLSRNPALRTGRAARPGQRERSGVTPKKTAAPADTVRTNGQAKKP
jgi:hypothetical protein